MIAKIVSLSFLKGLALLISMFVNILVARVLNVEQFAEFSIYLSIVTVLLVPVRGGIQKLLIREYLVLKEDNKEKNISLLIVFFKKYVTYTSLVIISLLILTKQNYQLIIFSLCIPFLGFVSINSGIFRASKRIYLSVLSEKVLHLASFLCVVSFLLYSENKSLLNVIYAYVTTAIICFIFFNTKTNIANLSKNVNFFKQDASFDKKKLMSSLIPFTLIAGVGVLNSQMGILLLGFYNKIQVAELKIIQQFSNTLLIMLNIMNVIYINKITKCIHNNNLKQLKITLRNINLIAISTMIVLFSIFSIYGEYLVFIMFGKDYDMTKINLIIYMVAVSINVVVGPTGLLLNMSNNEKVSLYLLIFNLISNFLFSLLLSLEYGILGICIGLLISNFISCVLQVYYVSKKLKVYSGFVGNVS